MIRPQNNEFNSPALNLHAVSDDKRNNCRQVSEEGFLLFDEQLIGNLESPL